MTGICGWTGYASGKDANLATLGNMAEPLRSTSAIEAATLVGKNSAIATYSTAPRNAYEDNSILAAIQGDHYWSDSDLASRAKRDGSAAVLADTFRRIGPDVLKHLQGAFSLVVVDDEACTLFAAIDRMGQRPLAYTYRDGLLVFGSTTDSVRRHPLVTSTLDPQSVFSYAYFHVVPSPDTIYLEQKKLQPGQFLFASNNGLRTDFYWTPQFVDSSPAKKPELAAELHEKLQVAVKRCLAVPNTGAFLSGGVDSSTVTGFLSGLSEDPARTYSIGFSAQGYDEVSYAHATATHFNTRHLDYYVTPDDVAEMTPRIAVAYDEPFGNSSAIAAFFCAREAKADGTDVLLAGDGGDELFAGNARYAVQKLFSAYSRIPTPLRNYLIEPLAFSTPGGRYLFPLRKLQAYVRQAKIPLPARMENYNFLHRYPLEDMFDSDFLGSIAVDRPLTMLQETYDRAGSKSELNKMLFLDWKITLADNDLRKVTQTCELAGVHVRYPLLDDDIVELSTRIPTALKLRGFRLRYFFKWAMRQYLPADTLSKSKHGFGLPFGVWLRTDHRLQQLAYDSIASLKNRHYFRPGFLDHLMSLHRSDHAAFYGGFLWVLMVLEIWLQSREYPNPATSARSCGR